MSKRITLQWVVEPGYDKGDYARLCHNSGAGDIDFDSPAGKKLPLFPGSAGHYGFATAPFGMGPFGYSVPLRVPGFGNVPFGKGAFGSGAVTITDYVEPTGCGAWKLAFGVWDKLDNRHDGSPEQANVEFHEAPDVPSPLAAVGYNGTTGVLSLKAV